MTITQKILAAHAGVEKVEAGELIMVKTDLVLGNDITSPVAINEFEKAGITVLDQTIFIKNLMIPAGVLGKHKPTKEQMEDVNYGFWLAKEMGKVLIIGGLCGIVTSWNSFLIGGSRAIYAMSTSYMLPATFGKLHKKRKTPIFAIALVGGLSIIAPFFGRVMLVWIVDAANFACCLAYCMVSLSFVVLRKKLPDMKRPYEVKHYKLIGFLAVALS